MATFLLLLLAGGIIFKIYLKLSTGWCRSQTCLKGKTAIVTGANTGIGYYTALDLVKRGARVILACRNEEKGKEAVENIIKETGVADSVVLKTVDFESLDSVRKFAKDIIQNEDRLDILVNNAGAGGLKPGLSNDGLELGMQVNYFAPFLLTNLLLDLMKKSGPSRIVNVSSIAAKYAEMDLKTLNTCPGGTALYGISKLCNILFTIELAKKLKGTDVTTYSLHPGFVATEIFRRLPKVALKITNFVFKYMFKTSEEGAQTSIYLATAKDIERFSGEHFHDCKYVPRYGSVDIFISKKLWDKTEVLLEMAEEEKHYSTT